MAVHCGQGGSSARAYRPVRRRPQSLDGGRSLRLNTPIESSGTEPEEVFRRAREAREDAAALTDEARQSVRRAAVIHAETNAILDAVAKMMARVLHARGIRLRAPVEARFRTARTGSTGVEILVRLEDPRHADAARAALDERFPDPLADVIVG